MVQVDVFWSYGLGSGFALAASRQIQDAQAAKKSPFSIMAFTHTLLYLAIGFAPSGICLLWAFTSWETMHVFTYATLPAWLTTTFAVTNITQGILGFWVTSMLIGRGKFYGAALQTVAGYFLMFFILVHGWDGTGYQRFFSFTRHDFHRWAAHSASSNIVSWLTSPVALTLYGFGLVLIPWLLWLAGRLLSEGYAEATIDPSRRRPAQGPALWGSFLLLGAGYPLILAIGASLCIHGVTHIAGTATGWILGIGIFAVPAYAFVLRPGAAAETLMRRLLLLPGGSR